MADFHVPCAVGQVCNLDPLILRLFVGFGDDAPIPFVARQDFVVQLQSGDLTET